MQFTVSNAALVEALGWVAKSLPARPATPILAGVKLVVVDNRLTLSGYDYEQSAVASVEVEATSEGTALVSGRMFSDIARALPKGDVKVTLDGTRLLVQAKSSKFSLQVMPDGDYPSLPVTPAPLGAVDAIVFTEAVRKVAAAAGRDDTLPVLTAVSLAFDPEVGTVTLAATDRFRLAVAKVNFTPAPGATAINVLVPSRVLDSWAKSLAGVEGGEFALSAGDGTQQVFAISGGTRSATVRLLDGQYPNYAALIPKDANAETVVNSADFLAAVKRVVIVAPHAPTKVSFEGDGITVSAQADSEASEDVEANHVGTDITMAFNATYLQDGINAMGGGDMRVSLVASNKPVIIRGADAPDYTYLLMPMRA